MRPQKRFDNGLVSLKPTKAEKNNAHHEPADRGAHDLSSKSPIGFVVGEVSLFFKIPRAKAKSASEWARPWDFKMGLLDWFITEVAQQCCNSFSISVLTHVVSVPFPKRSGCFLVSAPFQQRWAPKSKNGVKPLWRWRYGRLNHHEITAKETLNSGLLKEDGWHKVSVA